MYFINFENSRNRRFTSSIESYLGSLSFLPDLFPRLNSIVTNKATNNLITNKVLGASQIFLCVDQEERE